jgi:CubicO group peptidase (beta-lactamase class C family)
MSLSQLAEKLMRLLARAIPVVLFVATAALAVPARAQPAADRAAAAQAQAALAQAAYPGGSAVAVLVTRGDTTLFRGARGMANVELAVPATPDSLFRIASVTKTFTAALIVQMAERGEVSLDAPARDYLSGLPLDPRITLRHLLSHSAGIADSDVSPLPPFGPGEIPLQTQLQRIAARPLLFAPGTSQRYSNGGYILLAGVIEQRTGMSWDEAMRTRLFRPLRLDDTDYDRSGPIVRNRVEGYTLVNGAVQNAGPVNISLPKTAGSLRSRLDDLRHWIRALAGGRVVSPAGFAAMTTPARPDVPVQERYGLGLYIWQVRGETVIGHTGQIEGAASALVYLPAHDIVIAVLANNDEFDAQGLARRLAAIALGHPYPVPRPATVPAAQLAMLAGRYGNDAATIRTLAVADGRLTMARGNRQALPVMIDSEGNIRFIPDELSYFTPVRDTQGRIVRLDYYPKGEGPALPYPRTGD